MPRILKENLSFLSITSVVLAIIFYLIYKSSILALSFDIDEADYMYSLEKGFAAHYFDRNTMSFISFVKIGLSKGLKNDKYTEISKTIRSADDISIYRHFHGPFYFYYMMLGEKIVGKSERAIRTFSLILQFLCSIIVLVGCLWLLGTQEGRLPALLAAVLALLSPTLYFTVSLVSPHGMYVLLCLLSLFFMAKAVAAKKKAYFFLSAVAISLAFVTFEYAFLLLLCWGISVIVLYRMDRSAFPRLWKFILKSFCIYVFVIVAVWPASFLKLSLIRGDIVQAYLFFARRSMFSSSPPLTFWWHRIADSPVEYGILVLGGLLAIYTMLKKKSILLIPFIAYLVLVFLMEFRHIAPVPTYVSSLVTVGFVTTALAASELLQKRWRVQAVLLVVLCVILFVYLRFYYLHRQVSPGLLLRTEMTAFLKKEMPKKILVARPMLSLVHYYFRAMTADSYTHETFSKSGEFADLRAGLTMNGDYNGVVYFGNFAKEVEAVIAERYACEAVVFSQPGYSEQWVYYRLQPKSKGAVQ